MTEQVTEGSFAVSVSPRVIESGLLLENLLLRLGADETGQAVLTGKMKVKLPNRVKPLWEAMGTGEQLNFIIESFISPPAPPAQITEQAKTNTSEFWSRGL